MICISYHLHIICMMMYPMVFLNGYDKRSQDEYEGLCDSTVCGTAVGGQPQGSSEQPSNQLSTDGHPFCSWVLLKPLKRYVFCRLFGPLEYIMFCFGLFWWCRIWCGQRKQNKISVWNSWPHPNLWDLLFRTSVGSCTTAASPDPLGQMTWNDMVEEYKLVLCATQLTKPSKPLKQPVV